MVMRNNGGFSYIAVPAFANSVSCSNVEDIKPAIGIVVFCEAITGFKAGVSQILCWMPPVCLDNHSVGSMFDDLPLILDFDFAMRIEFDDCDHGSDLCL